MNLLLVTQVVDSEHSDLGFFHAWITQFARTCSSVTVICLQEGKHALPHNVRVLSLGKEVGASRMTRLVRLFTYVWRERFRYDTVFVHMNVEYILVVGWLWMLLRKPISLWYVHKHVGVRLRIALWFVSHVFTTSTESFRISSPKVQIVGHGIPDEAFIARDVQSGGRKKVLMVGRLSRSKGVAVGVRVLAALGEEYELIVVGGTHTSDDVLYEKEVLQAAQDANLVSRMHLIGPLPPEKVRRYYATADVFLHLSTTGSTDKVVLEALAASLPVVSTSEAFRDTPGVYAADRDSVASVATVIQHAVLGGDDMDGVKYVRSEHSLLRLITVIVRTLQS